MEKLRRQLEKEERRIAKAEAKASRDKTLYNAESAQDNENKKRKWTNRGGSGNEKFGDSKIIKPMLQEAVSIEPGPLTPTSQPTIADEGFDLPAKALDADSASNQTDLSIGQEGDGPSLLRTSPTMLDSHTIQSGQNSVSPSAGSETPTSSSGPSSDSEGESDDEAPAETSTKRHRLDRVGPPKRKQPKQTCRVFLRNGLCKRGSSCKYSHVLPERGSRTPGKQEVKRAEGRKERIGLYQRVSGHVQRDVFIAKWVLIIYSCSSWHGRKSKKITKLSSTSNLERKTWKLKYRQQDGKSIGGDGKGERRIAHNAMLEHSGPCNRHYASKSSRSRGALAEILAQESWRPQVWVANLRRHPPIIDMYIKRPLHNRDAP